MAGVQGEAVGEGVNKARLESHELVELALCNSMPVILDLLETLKRRTEKALKGPSEGVLHLSVPSAYHCNVFEYLSALIQAVDRVKEAQDYLVMNPQKFAQAGIDRQRWIDYHYSVYVFTVTSIYDIALLLTNAVFRFGIRAQECKGYVISENQWVKNTPVGSALKKIFKSTEACRMPRHCLAHRGQVPKLQELTDLQLLSAASRYSDSLVDPSVMSTWYDLFLGASDTRLLLEWATIRSAAWELFDALLPVYQGSAKGGPAPASTIV